MESKVEGYSIVGGDNAQNVVNSVMAAIKDGWQPLGSVSVAVSTNEAGDSVTEFAQAMVLYKEIIFQ